MKCSQFNEALQALLDGNLSQLPETASAHLQDCAACQRQYEQLTRLQKMTHELPVEALSETATNGLAQRVAAATWHPRQPRLQSLFDLFAGLRWRRVFPIGAVAVALVLLMLNLTGRKSSEIQETRATNELDLLLEEHALVMENSIFATGALPVAFAGAASFEAIQK